MKSKTQSLTVLAVIVLLLALPMAVSAAIPPHPTYASADVDGDPGEWILATDFFANMYRAADPANPVESKLYLRYECPAIDANEGTPGILYALVLTESGVVIKTNVAEEQFIKLGKIKLVDDTVPDDDNAPDFHFITSGGDTIGWEASAPLAEGVYTGLLNVHTQVLDVNDEPQTSATDSRGIDLTLTCGNDPTAISLGGLSATNAGSSFPALPVLGVGMTALAAVVMVRRPRK